HCDRAWSARGVLAQTPPARSPARARSSRCSSGLQYGVPSLWANPHSPSRSSTAAMSSVGVGHGVTKRAVANFEVEDVFVCGIDEVMSLPDSGLEAGTHAGPQHSFALACNQQRFAYQNIDELILFRM